MIFGLVAIVALLAAAALAVVGLVIRRKNMHYWLKSYYLPAVAAEKPDSNQPLHVFLAVCDHWEPKWGKPRPEVALERVERWASGYAPTFAEFRDSDGRPPQHTFFFPEEEYEPEYLDRIATLCRAGFGDVEVHLHHNDDTAAALEAKLETFRHTLFHRHGLLRKDPRTGEIIYGFIHGNWSLCNSRPSGWGCGVDQELGVLMKTGCYADFTMPSAPDDTQTSLINSIYYAKDIPGRCKSHDVGILSSVGTAPPPGHLLMIQGPLSLDWRQARLGIVPRIENGDVMGGRPMSIPRWRQWIDTGVHVRRQPNWVFVKVHTHGCSDVNIDAWIGPNCEMRGFHRDLQLWAQKNPNAKYHYVTAWEMAQLVHQAEAGATVPTIGMPVGAAS